MTDETGVSHADPRDVYLARHGRTVLNAEGRLRGLADPPLDETGVAEARRLGAALASEIAMTRAGQSVSAPGDATSPHVLSSPLDRAVSTARIIAVALDASCSVDERWTDRDYGPQTGEIKSEIIARWGSVDSAPGVESVSAVVARVVPALDAMVRELTGGPIIVVTHDAVIRALVHELDPRRPALKSPTASWARLLGHAGSWQVVDVDRKPGIAE